MDLNILKFTAAVEKYQVNLKSNSDFDEPIVNELLDLALRTRGESRPDIMQSLPKDKKMLMIRQIAVNTPYNRIKLVSWLRLKAKAQSITSIYCCPLFQIKV